MNSTDSSPVMLYDGVCGLCNKSVQTILRLDKKSVFKFAALQSHFGEELRARHPELDQIDSVLIVEKDGDKERIFMRSSAVLRILHHLGGLWKIFLIGYLIPAPIRDFFYNLIARNRYKVFGKHETCMLPSPAVRSRFIEN